MSESTHRGFRCGQCYWALYDADWCQNPACKLYGQSVGRDETIKLSNWEAGVLIEAKAKAAATAEDAPK